MKPTDPDLLRAHADNGPVPPEWLFHLMCAYAVLIVMPYLGWCAWSSLVNR